MRTIFTAMLVGCIGLIVVSAAANAHWRYVSYYGGGYGYHGGGYGYYGGYGGYYGGGNWMNRASRSFSGGGY